MKRILYHIPQGSCYLEIVRIFQTEADRFKARVIWYFKPSKKFMHVEDIWIPKKAKESWQKEICD